MKQDVLNLNTENVKTFVEEHKIVIAAIGGITVGIALAALLGNEKAKTFLRSAGNTLMSVSGKFVNDLGGFKQLVAPLLAKSNVQGI
ncbi:MAG TPA: hypothetical protein VEW65_12100 [Chryseolinea sp.]|jgi:hypothetical protein|nr:hypothetical protein [Chryseolinea sp.]HZI26494.1 hypothetical protein [Chryseolinea sp.]